VPISSTPRYGSSFLLEAVQSFQQEEKAAGSPRDELKLYLESGVESTEDVIAWWGVRFISWRDRYYLISTNVRCQTNTKYLTMRRIARDYLLIQGSSTPSERAFSSGGITGSARRSRLSTEIFEALQILKSAYRNGHDVAARQAGQHIDAMIMGFDDDFEGWDK
jgi:hypothetical protein